VFGKTVKYDTPGGTLKPPPGLAVSERIRIDWRP
jgi:hypothetical protein